jgi:glutamate dehydrogenase
MDAAAKMLASPVPDEDWMAGPLRDYFPPSLLPYQEHFADHPLRREIATAKIVNSVVDRGGITFLYRLQEETGAELPHLVRIFTVVCEVFGLDGFVADVCALDGTVSADVQATLLNEHIRLLDRASRWFVHQSPESLDVLATIETFREPVTRLRAHLADLLQGDDRAEYEQARRSYAGQGVPDAIAARAAGLLDEFALLDVVQESQRVGASPEDVAGVYYAVTDAVSGSALLDMIRDLDRSSRWSALARGALRDDYYQAIVTLTDAVMRHTDTAPGAGSPTGASGRARVQDWMDANGSVLEKVLTMVAELRELPQVDQAPVSVVLRQLRGVVRTADWASEAE